MGEPPQSQEAASFIDELTYSTSLQSSCGSLSTTGVSRLLLMQEYRPMIDVKIVHFTNDTDSTVVYVSGKIEHDDSKSQE